MEERAVGGKEKKYVLYTVVNDDKARAGFGVWMVRILLGSLLLVALAVVPYVSLRLAQVNDRTLVVFQPVPIHNHSRNHHHKMTSSRPGSVAVTHILQSAALVRENHTTEIPKAKKSSNATILTLHESAVTLSLLEDTNNVSQTAKNQSTEVAVAGPATAQGEPEDIVTLDEMAVNVTSSPTPVEVKTEVDETFQKDAAPVKEEAIKNAKVNTTSDDVAPVVAAPSSAVRNAPAEAYPTSESTPPEDKRERSTLAISEKPNQEETSKQLKAITSTATSTVTNTSTTMSTTSRPIPKFSSTSTGKIIHKLAYLATASSGNHVGGICIWKTNKTVTEWSYFYDNIPIEFQSRQDSTDHEMRALLAAVRLWSDKWHDYHVVLRSQHQAIKGSKHQTRVQLGDELDQLSKDHFTYELEWRQKRDDSLMDIAYSLARLYKDFDYWLSEFEQRMDELLGEQDWAKKKKENRMQIPQELFATDRKPERSEDEIGDLTSLGLF